MLSVLSYPVEQPYRIRWITEMFYAGSAILIVLLILFNLVVSGYDTVAVITANPNITDPNQWWAPSWVPKGLRIIRSAPGECEPAVLPFNTPLRTNSSLSLFSYTLLNTFSQHGQQDSYKANSLDGCRVQDMTMSIETRALAFEITTTLSCTMAPNITRPREFGVYFRHTYDSRFRPDTIVDYMAQQLPNNPHNPDEFDTISRNGPPKEPFLNVLGVLDALNSDLAQLLWMQRAAWSNNSTIRGKIPDMGYVFWNAVTETPHAPSALSLGTYDAMNGNLSEDEDISYFYDMNTTIANALIATRDAIYLDVGYVTPANIYVNRSTFNESIIPDGFFPKLVSFVYPTYPYAEYNTVSWGWGKAPGSNASWAQALTSTNQPVNNITLPIVLQLPPPPSVINIMYLCPQYQLKSWGSLFMALFTGTFSAYASLYGLFAWLGPIFDRERHGPQPLELLVDQQNRKAQLEGFDSSVPDLKSSKSSLDLESSVKDHLLSSDIKEKS